MVSSTKAKRVEPAEGEVMLAGLPRYVRLLTDRGPLGYNAGDTNLYRYVGNNPTDLVDPCGLDTKVLWEADPTYIDPRTVDVNDPNRQDRIDYLKRQLEITEQLRKEELVNYFYCNRFFLGAPAVAFGIVRRGGNVLVLWCQA